MKAPLLFGFVLVLISGCEENNYNDSYLPIEKTLRGLAFKKGSYWIYRDSASGALDSTYITDGKNWDQFVKYAKLQEYEMAFHTFFGKPETAFRIEGFSVWFGNGTIYGDRLLTRRPGGVDTQTAYFHRGNGILRSANIGGKTYDSVWISEVDSLSNKPSPRFDRFYFKDSIGILRYQAVSNGQCTRQWDLLRHSVTLFPFQ